MDNAFSLLGFPPEFGLTILLLSLVLLISPYLAGSDFGFIKVPMFSEVAKRRLYVLGPLLMALSTVAHIPFFESKQPRPAEIVDESYWRFTAKEEIDAYLKLAPAGGIGVGYHCRSGSRCTTGYCSPGPENFAEGFCKSVDKDCAWPGKEGYLYGEIAVLAGRRFKCIDGGERQVWVAE